MDPNTKPVAPAKVNWLAREAGFFSFWNRRLFPFILHRLMNKKQLQNLGVPNDCIVTAIGCVQNSARDRSVEPAKKIIPRIVKSPSAFVADLHYGPLAMALIRYNETDLPFQEIPYRTWGADFDDQSLQQLRNACRLPVARAAALMPDAHSGYGLPIGGVLACENAVVPYAVGVDIACRMKMTVTDLPVELLVENDPKKCRSIDQALQQGTLFGTGEQWKRPNQHAVLDEDWSITAVTREMYDRATGQLGTSGSGNHFVEWGILTLLQDELGLKAGTYVALLSHSGSRGPGARVCQRYTEIARQSMPSKIKEDPQLKHLSWLTMDSEAGQEYWLAMNLMGRFASANHEVIHQNVTKLAGAQKLATVENHHNFAWLEEHGGKQLYVHRKGATPAGKGELGVIPGNMADSCFLIRGKGHPDSLNSASHGAGRRMSRTAAKAQFNWKQWRKHLAEKNVRLLAGGLDEVPGAYKNIHEVMSAQSDLVDIIGEFFPHIVMMCGDNSRAED
jgi:tRNA-splicing ligase RtcB (3'-phosphate/5'-hydroxy nucleic acid ligase)